MRSLSLLAVALAAAFASAFALAQASELAALADPTAFLEGGRAAAAALGVALLVGDVFLPVPSSVLMTAHGALFGVMVGSALSLVGSLGAAALAFGLGRLGAPLLDRWLAPEERRRGDALLGRWGGLAILLTRPVPIAAETVAVIAGASSLGWGRLLAMSSLGSLPFALLYAALGAHPERVEASAVVAAGAVALVALALAVGRRARRFRV